MNIVSGMPQSAKQGFTLVELSIVLVILGLLVGGVLSGQSLIHAAELRSITTQYNNYVAAVQTFRDKYFALPGDMANASSFWGAADGSTGLTSTCYNTAGTGTATCNGDGNGQVFYTSGSDETMRFWQHLANAGLVEGHYDGIPHGSGNCEGSDYCNATLANSPAGKVGSSLWITTYWGTLSNNGYSAFDGDYGNIMEFGALTPNADPHNPILKPEDAWNIDTKMDDGSPVTGSVGIRAFPLNSCTDQSAVTATSANYLLSSSAIACALIFRHAY